MFEKLKEFLKFASESGLRLPTAYDADKQGPSVSLLFANISFYVAVGCIIWFTTRDLQNGTIAAMLFAALYFVFYLLRRLTKAKFDLDDKSIDLENNEEKEEK